MSHNVQPIEVLIAEDEETDAFFVESAFGQSSLDINVHWVKDGQDVIDYLKNAGEFVGAPRPHLIIMDLNMPRKNGHDTLAEIKSDERFRDIPVIIVSGSTDEADIKMAYGLHANAYMPKSNGFEDMMEFIAAIEQFWFLKARLPAAVDTKPGDKAA